jgi:hypothetical protein
VSLGTTDAETNFTSYLWFNSSVYPGDNPDIVAIKCSSAQSSKTMYLRSPGVVIPPSSITCNITLNEMTNEVNGQCGWKYTSDLSMVALFNVKIFLGEQEMVNIWVANDTMQVSFTLQSSNGNANYKAIVSSIDHCDTYYSTENERFEQGEELNNEAVNGGVADVAVVSGVSSLILFSVLVVSAIIILC